MSPIRIASPDSDKTYKVDKTSEVSESEIYNIMNNPQGLSEREILNLQGINITPLKN